MSTKEIQQALVEKMEQWKKIEDASVASTEEIMKKTDNPLIHKIMEIIQADSMQHHKVQNLILKSLTEQSISLTPEEIGVVQEGIDKHAAIEKKMVGFVEETLSALKGRKMVIQEYLLEYLAEDEKKHDNLLSRLEDIKKGMYPYG